MESVQTAVLCACMTSLGLTLAEGLLPMEKYGRQIRILFAALLLTAMLRPLVGADLSLPESIVPQADITQDITEAAAEAQAEAVGACIRSRLQQELAAQHVNCEVQSVSVHIQPDGGIVIDEVAVAEYSLTAAVYLREWLGGEVPITDMAQEEAIP